MRQWIRKYSWTPSWTVNMKILLDIRVTVTFQRAFQPSAGLSYWKIGTTQMCMKWLLIIRHVNSVEQCRTVSIVSTVSTVIVRCYLHLRWYFSTFKGVALIGFYVFFFLPSIVGHIYGFFVLPIWVSRGKGKEIKKIQSCSSLHWQFFWNWKWHVCWLYVIR